MTAVEVTDIAGKIVKLGELDEGGNFAVIGAEHKELHDGLHYFAGSYDGTVDIASPKWWLLQAPNPLKCHFFLTMAVSGAVILELYEEGTVSANGDSVSVFNSDRNLGNSSGLTIFSDPTNPGGGNMLVHEYVGTTGKKEGVGALSRREDEIILKSGAKYLIKVTPEGDATQVCIHFSWYEVDYPNNA